MIARRGGLGGAAPAAITLALMLVAGAACRVDDDGFQERVFACQTSAPDPLCGKDAHGAAMTCFPASQLDGSDFCAESCGEPMSLADEGAVCVQGGAKLRFCRPSDDPTTAGGPCGRTDLGCLRTDVTADEGVCVTMQPCIADADCPNPVRSTCAATFLTELYSQATLQTDHLYCLQKNCVGGGSSCAPGQSCLPKLVAAAARPPDICVPNCDSQLGCPPNHFCFRKLSGLGSPAICLPGLLGFLCESDIDCIVGTCVSDGEPDPLLELELCTVMGASEDDCQRFDSDQGKFVRMADGRCATPDAYRGARCFDDADCTRDEGTSCVFSSMPALSTDQGTCSRLCPEGTCSPRGGFGHVCLPFTVNRKGESKKGCYPGYFGLPCGADADCVGGMVCRSAGGSAKFCTTPCQPAADDCERNRWTSGVSACSPTDSICVPTTILPLLPER